MISFFTGYLPDHAAYRAAILTRALSLTAGLAAIAIGFYASTSTTRQPQMALMVSAFAFALGLFASALFRATEAVCKSAARKREPFKATKFRKEIIAATCHNLMSKIVDSGMQRSGFSSRRGGGRFSDRDFDSDDD